MSAATMAVVAVVLWLAISVVLFLLWRRDYREVERLTGERDGLDALGRLHRGRERRVTTPFRIEE